MLIIDDEEKVSRLHLEGPGFEFC